MARQEGFEPSVVGFGDRCITVMLRTYIFSTSLSLIKINDTDLIFEISFSANSKAFNKAADEASDFFQIPLLGGTK